MRRDAHLHVNFAHAYVIDLYGASAAAAAAATAAPIHFSRVRVCILDRVEPARTHTHTTNGFARCCRSIPFQHILLCTKL